MGLEFLGSKLKWHRLDDGVMGGKSATIHKSILKASGMGSSDIKDDIQSLHFTGTINTDGGGFASVRSPLPTSGLPKNMKGFRVKFRGDGKTYKMLLSDGNRSTGGPFSQTPSWQIDLPTKKLESTNPESNVEKNCQKGDDMYEEAILQLKDFKPTFGGGGRSKRSEEEMKKFQLDAPDIKQIGFMLSLRLSDGTPNPKETFGESIFDFSLEIDSISSIMELN